jgi:hypothetical protein
VPSAAPSSASIASSALLSALARELIVTVNKRSSMGLPSGSMPLKDALRDLFDHMPRIDLEDNSTLVDEVTV